jgi:hypothetical protein
MIYPWNRVEAPFGSVSSSDQTDDKVGTAAFGGTSATEVNLLHTRSGRRIHDSTISYLGKNTLIAGGVRRYCARLTSLEQVES